MLLCRRPLELGVTGRQKLRLAAATTHVPLISYAGARSILQHPIVKFTRGEVWCIKRGGGGEVGGAGGGKCGQLPLAKALR